MAVNDNSKYLLSTVYNPTQSEMEVILQINEVIITGDTYTMVFFMHD